MRHVKVDEALDIIKQLGFPRQQQNERSALTLLALLDLKPDGSWDTLGKPLLGITPMMNFFAEHYGKIYAPNSRETVRRQTVHQFLQAGIIVENPDMQDRPTNSGKTVYRIDHEVLNLLCTYGADSWKKHLKEYLKTHLPLREQYAGSRQTDTVPLAVPSGKTINLSSGRHNELVRDICTRFAGKFAPGSVPLYVGDTAKKFAYFDEDGMKKLGIELEPHGKIPDVIIHDEKRNWMFLVEAVTSHGPIDAKRKKELQEIFASVASGIVYVTAFPDSKTMKKYVAEISWETEVWIAESPDHMIHFDGQQFLGPYAD